MAKTDTETEFSADERAAMKQRAAELKKSKSRGSGATKAAADLQDVVDTIAKLDGTDHDVAAKLHEIVTTVAPDLAPKTWYGFPAYANKDGKVIVFFKPASKFKTRYGEIGFNEQANLDDGDMWPTAYAVVAMTPAIEKKLTALVKRAAS